MKFIFSLKSSIKYTLCILFALNLNIMKEKTEYKNDLKYNNCEEVNPL